MNNSQKINLIAVLFDIQDQLLTELSSEYKQGMKQLCNNAMIHTKRLVKKFDDIHSEENQIAFGKAADDIRELIEKYINS